MLLKLVLELFLDVASALLMHSKPDHIRLWIDQEFAEDCAIMASKNGEMAASGLSCPVWRTLGRWTYESLDVGNTDGWYSLL